MRTRRLLVSVSALALLLSACGSDDEQTPTQTIEVTTTTEAAATDMDQAKIDAALLTISDVGGGYVAEDPGQSVDEPTGCAALDAIGDRLDEAEVKGEVLLSNEATGDLVNQIIAVDENAEADLASFSEAIGACASFAVDLEGQTVTFTAEPLDLSEVGDKSEAGRFTTTLLGTTVSIDYVILRKGDTLSAILATSYDNAGSDRIASLGQKAADKLDVG